MNIKTIITAPIILIIILSAVLTNFFISFEEKVFNEQSKKIENKIILEKKGNIKNSINNIITILNQKSESFINLQKGILKERTNNAVQLIDNIYKENKHLAEQEIFVKIKQYLNFISTADKSKYYYIYKMDGTCISVPANRNLEGKDLIDLQDIKGQYVIKTIIDIAKNGGGFNEWYYLNPKSKEIEKKIGYAVWYKPLDIFIGTAIYEQDIIEDIKRFSSKLLNNFKTSQGGYIYAYDYKANTIAHIKKDLIGVNRWNEMIHGQLLIQQLIEAGQKDGGSFLKYNATINPNARQSTNKISFMNKFEKLGWIVGTGFYTKKLYSDIKINQEKLKAEFGKELKNIIISAIVSTLILVILLWIILDKLSKRLIRYKKELENNNRELKDLNINLDKKVKEKTKEIINNAKKQRKLEQQLYRSEKMASMGEMIGNIAHQWRQPLSVISTGSTGMKMQKELNILTDEIFYETCDAINDNAQYLSKTIDDFRDFIKGDSKALNFNLRNDTNAFLRLVDAHIKSYHINVVLNLEEDININGYPKELIQCFINIFNNAKDALVENNEEDNRYIFVAQKITNDNIVIKFKDNAGGMPEDILPKIFEPYFTTKHQSQGTGLGLNMTYKLIVDGMGGTIEASNVSYKYDGKNYIGAEFVILLPLEQIDK